MTVRRNVIRISPCHTGCSAPLALCIPHHLQGLAGARSQCLPSQATSAYSTRPRSVKKVVGGLQDTAGEALRENEGQDFAHLQLSL